jgi:hypothetical protein
MAEIFKYIRVSHTHSLYILAIYFGVSFFFYRQMFQRLGVYIGKIILKK